MDLEVAQLVSAADLFSECHGHLPYPAADHCTPAEHLQTLWCGAVVHSGTSAMVDETGSFHVCHSIASNLTLVLLLEIQVSNLPVTFWAQRSLEEGMAPRYFHSCWYLAASKSFPLYTLVPYYCSGWICSVVSDQGWCIFISWNRERSSRALCEGVVLPFKDDI